MKPRARAHSHSEVSRSKLARFRTPDVPSSSSPTRTTMHANDVPMREPPGDAHTTKEMSQAKRIRIAPSIARASLLMVRATNAACPSAEVSASVDAPEPHSLHLSARV